MPSRSGTGRANICRVLPRNRFQRRLHRTTLCGVVEPARGSVCRLGDGAGDLGVRRRAGRAEERVDADTLLLEAGEQIALEHAAARQADAERIDRRAVDAYLEMEMRAGREAGR